MAIQIFCGKVWLAWSYDSAAHYTELYGYEAVYLPKNFIP